MDERLRELNEELSELNGRLARANGLERRLDDLRAQYEERKARVEETARLLTKEREDVEKLERGGLRALLLSLTGDREARLSQERREELAQLMRAMEALSPSQRELVQKVFFENQKIVDIAREEGVSHAAIHDRLTRIYKKIKNNL